MDLPEVQSHHQEAHWRPWCHDGWSYACRTYADIASPLQHQPQSCTSKAIQGFYHSSLQYWTSAVTKFQTQFHHSEFYYWLRFSVPCNADARVPFEQNSNIRYSPFSTQHPRRYDVFGWHTCPWIPSSARNSFSFCSLGVPFASLFTATCWPSDRTPLYTSA